MSGVRAACERGAEDERRVQEGMQPVVHGAAGGGPGGGSGRGQRP